MGPDVDFARYVQERYNAPGAQGKLDRSWEWCFDRGHPKSGIIRRRARWMAQQMRGHVLDVGCGSGLGCWFAARQATVDRVVGVDACTRALQRAEAHVGLANVAFVEACAEALPFEPDTFDSALVGELLEHVLDPAAVLQEVVRVVRPGGPVVVSVPHGGHTSAEHLRTFTRDSFRTLTAVYLANTLYTSIEPWLLCRGETL